MPLFDDFQIMPSYYVPPDVLTDLAEGVGLPLLNPTAKYPADEITGRAKRVSSARLQLSGFVERNIETLSNSNFLLNEAYQVFYTQGTFDNERGFYSWSGAAEYVFTTINGIPILELPGGYESFTSLAYTAFTSQDLDYHIYVGRPENRRIATYSLDGADGRVMRGSYANFVALGSLLTRGREWMIRSSILCAEATFAGAQTSHYTFEQAIGLYDGVVSDASFPVEVRQYAACRRAHAYLEAGERTYRRYRYPNAEQRSEIMGCYENAVNSIQQPFDLTSRHPEIVLIAGMQETKLANGLDYLGYPENYVPALTSHSLFQLAKRRVDEAQAAINSFEKFYGTAEQKLQKLQELNFQLEVKEKEEQRDKERVEKADNAAEITRLHADEVQKQIDQNAFNTFAGVLQGVLTVATAIGAAYMTGGAAVGAMGIVGGFNAMISTGVNFVDRKGDLEIQKLIADKQCDIAVNDQRIAEIEKQITDITQLYFGNQLAQLQADLQNPEACFKTAQVFRNLAVRHMNTAVLWAALYERAVEFRRVAPRIDLVQLNYADGDFLSAAANLNDDLITVSEKDRPPQGGQTISTPYSLAEWFPLEFTRDLKQGKPMSFSLSLYDVTRKNPGRERERIVDLEVEVKGTIAEDWSCRIRHNGTFLLRDREGTLNPSVSRFVPTVETMKAKLGESGIMAGAGYAIDGVIAVACDASGSDPDASDTLELSKKTPTTQGTRIAAMSPDELQNRRLMEGFGPAGNWRLEFVHQGPGANEMDMRGVTDVVLHITTEFPGYDAHKLEPRVKELLVAYEAELLQGESPDRIIVLSMRSAYRDPFRQLASGHASFELERAQFVESGDLRLKTIGAIAIGENGKPVEGIRLRLWREGSAFDIGRTTGADGFTEASSLQAGGSMPTLPKNRRFAVEGTYQLSLLDPTQFSLIAQGDLLLFVFYELHVAIHLEAVQPPSVPAWISLLT